MKILFLAQEHPVSGSAGGIATYVGLIAPALAQRGHEVHVIVCHGSTSEDLIKDGVYLHLRPMDSLPVLRKFASLSHTHKRLAAARSARLARAEFGSFDAIETPEWMAQSIFLSARDKRRLVVHLHTPIGITAAHGGYLGKDAAIANRLENRTVRSARALTSASALLVREMRLPLQEVTIIRLPVEPKNATNHQDSGLDQPTVLFVGRLEARKGLDVLIRAMALLPPAANRVRLIAVGRSSGMVNGFKYGLWIKRQAEAKGINYQHYPERSREELTRIYLGARLLVVPSHFESFSMVAAEGMAAGIPVICSDRCGIAEIIRGTSAGSVVPAGDPEALAKAMSPFLADASLAASAGREGQRVILEKCAPSVIAAQRETVYERVAVSN